MLASPRYSLITLSVTYSMRNDERKPNAICVGYLRGARKTTPLSDHPDQQLAQKVDGRFSQACSAHQWHLGVREEQLDGAQVASAARPRRQRAFACERTGKADNG
jgi:hypothetical protein